MQIKQYCIKTLLLYGLMASIASASPITIEADRASMQAAAGRTEFEGKVVVTQAKLQLKAARLVIEGQNSQSAVITAYGAPATFVLQQAPRVTGRAQMMIFRQASQTLTLEGGAEVTRGGDSVQGQTILYDMRRGHYQVKSPQGDERVRVILHPPTEKSNNE